MRGVITMFRHETKLSKDQINNIVKRLNAGWIHDGNPENPHAVLTSGLCSNAYFNVSRIASNPIAMEGLAYNLMRKILPRIGGEDIVVVGSAYAGIIPSYMVALHLGASHVYTEKGPKGEMVWTGRFSIPEDAYVLQIEDLITTFKTTEAVRRTIIAGNKNPVKFCPFVGTIVHRPAKLPVEYFFDGEKIEIISLIEKEVWAVPQEECPLCKQGSKRVKPKEHWSELTNKS